MVCKGGLVGGGRKTGKRGHKDTQDQYSDQQ